MHQRAVLAGGEVCHIWILALRRRLNGMICFKAGFDDRVD
jgi:hypothetical protein